MKKDLRTLLSIDPGKKSLAWAFFYNKILCKVGYEKTTIPFPKSVLENAKEASKILDCLADLVVVEIPKIYPTERRKNPNDLISVAISAGSCFCLGKDLEFVYPEEWKGQTPKKIQKERDFIRLNPAEKVVVGEGNSHIWDAVGIGLWRLGRGRIVLPREMRRKRRKNA